MGEIIEGDVQRCVAGWTKVWILAISSLQFKDPLHYVSSKGSWGFKCNNVDVFDARWDEIALVEFDKDIKPLSSSNGEGPYSVDWFFEEAAVSADDWKFESGDSVIDSAYIDEKLLELLPGCV